MNPFHDSAAGDSGLDIRLRQPAISSGDGRLPWVPEETVRTEFGAGIRRIYLLIFRQLLPPLLHGEKKLGIIISMW